MSAVEVTILADMTAKHREAGKRGTSWLVGNPAWTALRAERSLLNLDADAETLHGLPIARTVEFEGWLLLVDDTKN